jgi:MFS family permease
MFDKITARSKGFFYGWWMVAVGCGMRMLGGGFHLYGFTIFFLPITQELGLTRAATSLVFSLARAEGAIEGPLAGYLIDRFGPRPMMLAGVILSGVGYMLLAGVQTYYGLIAVYLGVISLSFSAGFMHSPMVLANSWFIRRRALAMTLISSSIGIGGTLITQLLAFSVQTWVGVMELFYHGRRIDPDRRACGAPGQTFTRKHGPGTRRRPAGKERC